MNLSIRAKMLVSVIVCFVVGVALIVWLLGQFQERNVESAAQNAVTAAQSNFAAVQQGHTERLYAMIDVLSVDSEVMGAFAERDREQLAAVVAPQAEVLRDSQGVNRWYFYMPLDDGTVFLRAYRGDEMLDPDNWGDASDRATYLQAAETGERTAGFELGRTDLALRAADVVETDGVEAGVMALGISIDEFLGAVAAQTGDEYAMFLDKEFFDAENWAAARESAGEADDWDRYPNAVLAQATLDDDSLLAFEGAVADVPDGGEVLGQVEESGRTFVRGAFPVYEAGGAKVAAIYVLQDITDVTEALRGTQMAILAGIVGLLVLISAVILVMLNKLVFARLNTMMSHVEDASLRLAGGDFDITMPEVTSTDEIGRFEKFLANFVKMVGGTLKDLSSK